jgi:hypothetical protein
MTPRARSTANASAEKFGGWGASPQEITDQRADDREWGEPSIGSQPVPQPEHQGPKMSEEGFMSRTGTTARRSAPARRTSTSRGGVRRNTNVRASANNNMSRDALYAQAKKQDIHGRSNMNKSQLQQALKK